MREVKWHPNERVDIPDMTALTRGVVGENRRMLRTLIASDKKYIVRGFKVEPEGVPSTRIVVKLDNGGGVLSAAIGAESAPILGLDYGALIGDHDISFLTEGLAQQILDFVGQPNGTYYIELRLVITDGASDNRIFLNPATITEYTAPVNTRRVHSWQVQFVGAPSGNEWLVLGTVAWSGVAITSAMITDLRDFVGEGVAPWQSSTQTSSAEGVPDFNRSIDRAANGLFGIAQIVRGALRQIRDLKGPTDGGKWDWFSRPHAPPGRTWAAGVTRHARSLETVTFRIADGVEDYGDFNGATGLQSCLTFIQANLATLPKYIKILILSRNATGEVTSKQTTSSTFSLTGKTVEIVGIDEGGGSAKGRITATVADGSIFLAAATVILRNISIDFNTTVGNAGLLSGRVELYDSIVDGKVPPSGDKYVIFCSSGGYVFNSTVRGRISVGGAMRFVGSFLQGVQIETSNDTVIENCTVTSVLTTLWTNLTTNRAVIDCAHFSGCIIRNCSFTYRRDLEAIAFAQHASFAIVPDRNLVERCVFNSWSDGSHTPYSIDATYGNGWGVRLDAPTGRSGYNLASRLTVRDCSFQNHSDDSGGILIRSQTPCTIDNCSFAQGTRSVAVGNTATCIRIDASIGTKISNCSFGPHSATFCGVNIKGSSNVGIHDCMFNGENGFGASGIDNPVTTRQAYDSAIYVNAAESVGLKILGNTFHMYASIGSSTTPGDGRTILVHSALRNSEVSNNVFSACVGYVFDAETGTILQTVFNGNTGRCATNTLGFNVPANTNYDIVFTSNVFDDFSAVGNNLLRYYINGSSITMMGNVATNMRIQRVSAAAADRGYNVTPGTASDFNNVLAYI